MPVDFEGLQGRALIAIPRLTGKARADLLGDVHPTSAADQHAEALRAKVAIAAGNTPNAQNLTDFYPMLREVFDEAGGGAPGGTAVGNRATAWYNRAKQLAAIERAEFAARHAVRTANDVGDLVAARDALMAVLNG